MIYAIPTRFQHQTKNKALIMDLDLQTTNQNHQNNYSYDSDHIMTNNNESKKQPLNIISNYMTQNDTQTNVNYTSTLKNTSTFVKISSLNAPKNINYDELKLKILNIQRSYMTNSKKLRFHENDYFSISIPIKKQ